MLLMKKEMIESDYFIRDGSKFVDIKGEPAYLVIERSSNKEVGQSVRVHVCACQAVPGHFPLEKLYFDRVVVLVVDQDCGKKSAAEKRIVAGKCGELTQTGSQSCLPLTQVGPARVCPSLGDHPH